MKTYQEVVSAPLTDDELEAMAHGYYAARVLETPDGRTAVTWTHGIPCAFPKADLIGFTIPSRAWTELGIGYPATPGAMQYLVIVVPWSDVVRVLGERWERRFNRYCVMPEQFPTADEWEALTKFMIMPPQRGRS
jgi:hypothetical protein